MRYGYMQFNTMFVRQGIAVSLFFLSLKYIVNKNLIKYLIINLIGFFFHASIIVVLPLYFFVYKRFSNIALIFIIFTSILLSFFNWIYIIDFISPKIMAYIESDTWGEMQGKFNIALLEKITIFSICIWFRRRLESKYPSFNILFNIFVLSIAAYYALFQMYVFQQRIAVMFQLSSIFIIPYILSLIKSEKIKFIILTLLMLIVTFFFMRYVMTYNVYIPYKSWLI
jgi:hypothetical protein